MDCHHHHHGQPHATQEPCGQHASHENCAEPCQCHANDASGGGSVPLPGGVPTLPPPPPSPLSPPSPCSHGERKPARDLVAEALQRLRAAGHRVTGQRKAMLRVLARTGPISIEALHRTLASGTADPATVYRSILVFEEVGLVQRHPLENGGNLYCLGGGAAEHPSHHHHVICRVCGRMEAVNGCVAEPFERVARQLGYSRITHVFEIYGVCAACGVPPLPSSMTPEAAPAVTTPPTRPANNPL